MALPLGPTLCNHNQMVSATKKIGRPATGIGTPVQVRRHKDLLALIDQWIEAQPDPKPSRPQAIRDLVELALKSSGE